MQAIRKKVLLSAFACDPYMGSEPYVGWNWLRVINKWADVTVLTRRQHLGNLNAELSKYPHEKVDILCFDLPGFHSYDHRARLIKPYYLVWQFLAPLVVLLRRRTVNFDVVHHLTYNAVDFPGLLWTLYRPKFVWGPVGGGQVPPRMAKPLYGKGWYKDRLRSAAKSLIPLNPFVRAAAWRAAAIIAANQDTAARLRFVSPGKLYHILETAVSPSPEATPRTISLRDDHITLLWVGVMEYRKGLVLAVDIARSLQQRLALNNVNLNIRLKVVGKISESYLAEFSLREDPFFTSSAELMGELKYEQVQRLYSQAHFLLFSSMQDTSGNVMLEALSQGIPVIAPNHQGAKQILQDGGGILYDVRGSIDCAIDDAVSKTINVISDPPLYHEMSSAALGAVASGLNWSASSRNMKFVYDAL